MYLLLLCCCFFWACQSPTLKESISKETTLNHTDTTDLAAKKNTTNTFKALPKLAIYYNEMVATQRTIIKSKIILEEGVLTLDGQDGYYEELDYKEEAQSMSVYQGETGTSFAFEEWDYVQLLEDGEEPIIGLISVSANGSRNYTTLLEAAEERMEWVLKQQPSLDQETAYDIAVKMEQKEELLAYDSFYHPWSLQILTVLVYQRKNNIWNSITPQAVSSELATTLVQHAPKLYLAGVANSQVKQAPLSRLFVNANQAIYQHWAPFEVGLGLKEFYIGQRNKTKAPFVWAWDGQQYTCSKKPVADYQYEENSWKGVDFRTNQVFTFKGNFTEVKDRTIELKVRFELLEETTFPKVRMKGSYTHLGQEEAFKVDAILSTKMGGKLTFYGMQGKKKVEEFVVYMENGVLKGWWQHLESLEIEEVSLKVK